MPRSFNTSGQIDLCLNDTEETAIQPVKNGKRKPKRTKSKLSSLSKSGATSPKGSKSVSRADKVKEMYSIPKHVTLQDGNEAYKTSGKQVKVYSVYESGETNVGEMPTVNQFDGMRSSSASSQMIKAI